MGQDAHDGPSPAYATVDQHNRGHPQDRDYRPPGGVPLFPNLPPPVRYEPLYSSSAFMN